MTNNKSLIVIVAVIVVIAAAAGAFLLLNNGHQDGKSDIIGTYDLYEGNNVSMQDSEVEKNKYPIDSKFTIESVDGNVVTITWGALKNGIKGLLIDDNTISFGGEWTVDNVKFSEFGTIYLKNGVLYIGCNAHSSDNNISVCTSATYVKDKSKTPAYPELKIEKGDVYKAYEMYGAYEGEFFDEVGIGSYTLTVTDRIGGVYVFKNSFTDEKGENKEFEAIGTMMSSDRIALRFGDDHSSTLFIGDGKITIDYNNAFTKGDHVYKEAYTFYMSKEKACEDAATLDLSGKAYNGTATVMDKNGKVTKDAVSFAFGESKHNFVDVIANLGENGYATTGQIAYSEQYKQYFVHFNLCIDHDGVEASGIAIGTISSDLKTLNIVYKIASADGSYIVAKADFTLNEDSGKGVIGCYIPIESKSVTGGSSYEFIPPKYDNMFAICYMKDHMVNGLFSDHEFVGVIDGSYIYFSYVCEGYIPDSFIKMQITDRGIVMEMLGEGEGMAFALNSLYSLAGSGKTPVLPEKESLFAVGEKYYASGSILMIGDEYHEYTKEEKPFSLECIYSNYGLYMFKAVIEGSETYLCGYVTTGKIISAAGYDSRMITYNINKHSDNLLCIDREFKDTKTGKSSVISYRMTGDGEKVDLPTVTDLNGAKYEGTAYVYELVDGVVKTRLISDYNISFNGQKSSLIFKQDSEKTNVIVHLKILGVDLKAAINPIALKYYDEFDINGNMYAFEVLGLFSSDMKELKIFATSSENMHSSYFLDLHRVA